MDAKREYTWGIDGYGRQHICELPQCREVVFCMLPSCSAILGVDLLKEQDAKATEIAA